MKHWLPQLKNAWLLALATLITVAIVSASQLFTQRISLLLDNQASELIAADMLIKSAQPLSPAYQKLVLELGLKTAKKSSPKARTRFATDRVLKLLRRRGQKRRPSPGKSSADL